MIRRTHASPAAAVVLVACAALDAPPSAAQTARFAPAAQPTQPALPTQPAPAVQPTPPALPTQAPHVDVQARGDDEWLRAGSIADPYWVIDNRWGQGSIPSNGFYQGVGVATGSDGSVAFRMQWQWPQGDTEVKGYPAALYGRKPGYAGYTASLLQRAGSSSSNGSEGSGGLLPLRLPLPPLKARLAFQHNGEPTGQGQLTFDLWLQSSERQDNGWAGSSITHEIMIPLDHWGNYGAHHTPGGRNPGWYDHDATIAGKLYHVYITKDGDGCSRYNFGSLNGAYGKTGWKLIAFVPAQLPVGPGEIDLAAIVNHVATQKDACGEPWARGDEYLVSAELGVEPVVGNGDITVYGYQVLPGTATGTATVTGRAVAPPSSPGRGNNHNDNYNRAGGNRPVEYREVEKRPEERKQEDRKRDGRRDETKREERKPEVKQGSWAPEPKQETRPPAPKPQAKPPEPKPEAKPPEPKPEAKPPAPRPEAKPPEPKPEVKPPEPKPEAKPPEPTPEVKPSEPKPETKPETKPPEPKPEAQPPEPQPQAKPPEPEPQPNPSEPKPSESPQVAKPAEPAQEARPAEPPRATDVSTSAPPRDERRRPRALDCTEPRRDEDRRGSCEPIPDGRRPTRP